MLDLENREVLIQYLLEKGVIHSDIPYEVNYCRGGVSCIAALIETEGKTMLVKQGKADCLLGGATCRSRPHEDRSHRQ